MDAANLSIKKIALSLAFALLIPAAAFAQPSFSPSLTSIVLSGQTPANETVSSTTSTAITFSATLGYAAGDPTWLCLSANGLATSQSSLAGLTTPASFTLSVGNCGQDLINFTGTHTANITLIATDSSGATSVTIPVSYTVGSGGTTGTSIAVSPTSITQTINYGTQAVVDVTLTSSSVNPLTFTLGTPPFSWVTWVQISGNGGLVSAAQNAVIQVTFNGAGQLQTALNTTLTISSTGGTLSIPVTLNNGVAGGGSGTTGSLSISPISIPWSYANTSPGVYPSATSVALSSTNGAIGYSAIASSSNGWLLINNGYSVSNAFVGSTPLTLSPFTTNVAALSPGTYFGTVNITGSDGSTGTITVTLTVTGNATGTTGLNPSLSAINLVGATPGTETITTSSSTSIAFSADISYNNGDPQWLCLDGSQPVLLTNLSTPSTITVTVGNCPGQDLINFTGTHTASLTLVPTNSSGISNVIIPISYTVGSGGGGGTGTVVASPSSLNATVAYGNQTTVSFTLTTSSTTPIAFTLAGTPVSWASWFQVSGNTGFVSSAQPAIIDVTLNGAGQPETSLTATLVVNNQTGTLNIPVTLNNGVTGTGTGTGTGGTGSLSVSPTTVAWSYSTSNPGAYPNPSSISLTSTNGAIGYTAQASSSNNWLLVNSGLTAAGTVGQTALTVSPSPNLAALSGGTYTGTVNITGSDGSTGLITVTVSVSGTNSGTISISPNPISLSALLGGGTVSTNVTITSAVTGTLSLSASGSGLSVSPTSTNVTAGVATTVTVFGNPSGLANGTYSGTLSANVAGSSSSASISFAVGANNSGGGTTASAAPSQLNFYYEPNTSMAISQSQQLYLGGSGNYTITSSTANTATNWLTAPAPTGVLPATVYVTASATGLASGTYNGYLTVTNNSTGQSSTVTVTLLVNGITTLYTSPGDWVFTYIANVSSVSQFQQITVASSDSTLVPISASVTNPGTTPWLSVSGSGYTPVGLLVTTNATGLANGTYTGSITVTGGNNPLTIPIVLVVTGSSVTGTGTLSLSSTALTLQAQVNGGAVSQSLSVSSTVSTAFTATAQGVYNGITWLTVSPSGTSTAPTTLTIIASPVNLQIGTYTGTVSLATSGQTQTVTVTFVVGTTTGGSTVSVTANGGSSTSPSLTFTAATVGAGVTSQYLSVTSGTGQSSVLFTASASTSSGGNWLLLGTVAGTQYATPINALTVSVNDSGLVAGTYNGQITISPVSGTAVTVPVALTVAATPSISVGQTSLSFAYSAGGATPATQTVPVTVTNASSGSFTATAASTPAGWLAVTPTSGTAPSNVTVSIVPAGLAAGTYTGTITVAGGSGATGSATVNVTLTVTVPLPTITAVVNGASFVNEPISPGEIITIGGTNLGPATPASLTLSGNFVTTTLGGVQVLINGYSAPLLYVSQTQINCVVPYEIAGIQNPTVIVKTNVTSGAGGQSSNGFGVNASATAPAIFTANGSGTGPGAILNADFSSNVSSATARGGVVQVFMTGEGQTSPQGVDGKVTAAPYPSPLLPISITVAGAPANYQFAGEAPGLVSGVLQLNVVIPPTLTVTGNVPLVVTIGSNSTQTGVTVNIK